MKRRAAAPSGEREAESKSWKSERERVSARRWFHFHWDMHSVMGRRRERVARVVRKATRAFRFRGRVGRGWLL